MSPISILDSSSDGELTENNYIPTPLSNEQIVSEETASSSTNQEEEYSLTTTIGITTILPNLPLILKTNMKEYITLLPIKISYQEDNNSVKVTKNTVGRVMNSPYELIYFLLYDFWTKGQINIAERNLISSLIQEKCFPV